MRRQLTRQTNKYLPHTHNEWRRWCVVVRLKDRRSRLCTSHVSPFAALIEIIICITWRICRKSYGCKSWVRSDETMMMMAMVRKCERYLAMGGAKLGVVISYYSLRNVGRKINLFTSIQIMLYLRCIHGCEITFDNCDRFMWSTRSCYELSDNWSLELVRLSDDEFMQLCWIDR